MRRRRVPSTAGNRREPKKGQVVALAAIAGVATEWGSGELSRLVVLRVPPGEASVEHSSSSAPSAGGLE